MVPFLSPDSVRHPGVLITNCPVGLKLDEGVLHTWNQEHLYWEDLSAGPLGPALVLITLLPLSRRVSFQTSYVLTMYFSLIIRVINELLQY